LQKSRNERPSNKNTLSSMNIEQWKHRARQLESETYALYLACRDPRVPWYAKAFAVCIVGYAVSPIDLVPDFVPVLGYLDDLVLVPLGITLAIKMIPPTVLDECRKKAREALSHDVPGKRAAAAIVVAVWLLLIAFIVLVIGRAIKN